MKSSPSLSMKLSKLCLKIRGNHYKPPKVSRWIHNIQNRTYPSPHPMPRSFHTQFNVEKHKVNGQPVYTISPLQDTASVHVIYTYGGAYVNPLRREHWKIISKLIETVNARVTVPIYPLAPEHSYKETFQELEDVYRRVLNNHDDQKIVLCGDSAGGGLALAQTLHYRDMGIQLPNHIVLFSPWLDITMSNPDAAAAELQDVMLGIPGLVQCGKWWAGGEDPHMPLLSPIFGDMSGLPPIDVFQGTSDVFIADTRKLKEKVFKAGGNVNLYEYPGAFHVFVGATFTPEAKDVFNRISKVL